MLVHTDAQNHSLMAALEQTFEYKFPHLHAYITLHQSQFITFLCLQFLDVFVKE